MSNYFAPALRVEVNGSNLAADVSNNIEQVSVISESNAIDTFSLTLLNQYPKLRWTHSNDANLFGEGSTVKIAMALLVDPPGSLTCTE